MCNVNDEAISKPKMDCAIKDMKRGKQMCMYILYIMRGITIKMVTTSCSVNSQWIEKSIHFSSYTSIIFCAFAIMASQLFMNLGQYMLSLRAFDVGTQV